MAIVCLLCFLIKIKNDFDKISLNNGFIENLIYFVKVKENKINQMIINISLILLYFIINLIISNLLQEKQKNVNFNFILGFLYLMFTLMAVENFLYYVNEQQNNQVLSILICSQIIQEIQVYILEFVDFDTSKNEINKNVKFCA